MSLSSLNTNTNFTPAPDPGMLKGGVRNNQIKLNNISSEFLRDAKQNQDVFQTSRAFSGALNNNSLTQSEYLNQTGTASNIKDVSIDPPAPPSEDIPDAFKNKWLYETVTGVEALEYLARGMANNAQDQLGGQSAFASMTDFDGYASEATNNLFQDEVVEQNLDFTEIQTHVKAPQAGHVLENARFRKVDLLLDNHDAQAITTSSQRQGYTSVDPDQQGNPLYDAPVTQFGGADGAIANNNLSQSVQAKQRNNVLMNNTYDLRANPQESLTPRTFEINVDLNANGGANRAINSESSFQSQALVQQAHGGVDEAGNMTEDGGYVTNTAVQIADLIEEGHVQHITNILV